MANHGDFIHPLAILLIKFRALQKNFQKEIKGDCFSAALAHNPSIGKIDPYIVAQHAVIEACAKTVSVGGFPACTY